MRHARTHAIVGNRTTLSQRGCEHHNILAAVARRIDIRPKVGLDIVRTFAMHSIRELAGSHDLAHLVKVLAAFYASAELA